MIQVFKDLIGFLLYHLKKYYKLIAIDLSKQQKLNADSKAMQQNERDGITNVFITEEAKQTILDFSQRKDFSQLNKLKSGIKYGTKVTLKFSSNIVRDSNEDNNFPHRLFRSYQTIKNLTALNRTNRSISR